MHIEVLIESRDDFDDDEKNVCCWRYKKNLKALYIVHPTTWIKFLWPFLRSLIRLMIWLIAFVSILYILVQSFRVNLFILIALVNWHLMLKCRFLFDFVGVFRMISFSFDPIIPIEIPLGEIKSTTKFHVPLQL